MNLCSTQHPEVTSKPRSMSKQQIIHPLVCILSSKKVSNSVFTFNNYFRVKPTFNVAQRFVAFSKFSTQHRFLHKCESGSDQICCGRKSNNFSHIVQLTKQQKSHQNLVVIGPKKSQFLFRSHLELKSLTSISCDQICPTCE